MASDMKKKALSDDDVKFFKSILEKYEPYDLNDPILEIYDNPEIDENRFNATLAKKALLDNGISIK